MNIFFKLNPGYIYQSGTQKNYGDSSDKSNETEPETNNVVAEHTEASAGRDIISWDKIDYKLLYETRNISTSS